MNTEERSDRLIEAACAILNVVANHRLNIVVLNKALFYLDLVSLRDYARTVTQNSFIAIRQGPVIAKYPQRLVGQLEARGFAKQLSEWDGSKPVQLEKLPERFNYLDSDALTFAAAVASDFATMSSHQASEYSHENPGWRLAWNEFVRTGRPAAIDMRIAMQQVIEDDNWMESPPSDEQIFADADRGIGIEW